MPVNIPTRSFDDIVRDSKNYLTDNSKIKNLTRTSTAKLILDGVAFEQTNQYNFQKSQFLNAYLSTSNGSYLDEIGYLFNCKRTEPCKATDTSTTNFRFYIDPSYNKTVRQMLEEFYITSELQDMINAGYSTDGTNLIIPTNIEVTNLNGTTTYKTDTVVNMSASSIEGYSAITAESTGKSYNIPAGVLIKHNLNEIPQLRKIANLILCENKFGISNGDGFEFDENYRWRISNKVVGNSSANETAIRLAAFSTPGVRNISIVSKAYGTGTFRVFVEGINPIVTDGLLNAVKENIQRSSAVGEQVYVSHPVYLGVETQIQLQFDYNANRNLLREAARTSVIDYINNLGIGGEIVINEIIQRIMSISDQIKDMNIVLFGYGTYNKYTEVNEDFLPLRLSNQKCKWSEMWYTNNRLCSICEFGSEN